MRSGPGRGEEKREAPPELRAALDVLGLGWPVDTPALRTRYKELAKQLHPDLNGADRAAEERLKDVNRAYSLLRQRLGAGRATAPAEPRRGRPLAPEPAAGLGIRPSPGSLPAEPWPSLPPRTLSGCR